MQRWTIILTAAAVGLWMIVQFARDFVTNDPIGYFTANPGHLLPVAILAVGGGAAACFYSRCTAGAQCATRLWSWGAAASIISALNIVLLQGVVRMVLSPFGIDRRGVAWMTLGLICSIGLAIYLWWEFCRTWKNKT